MNPAIPDDVDTELSRYLDAEEIGKAGINPAVIKQKKVTYNKQRGVNEMFMPLPSGGYTKIGEEKVVDPVPPQDVGKPPPDQVFDQATASWQEPAPVDRTAEMSTPLGEPVQPGGLPLELGGEPPAPEPSAFDGALSETVKGMVRGGLVAPSQFLKDNFGLYDPLVVQIVDPETGEFSPGLKILSRQEKEDLDRRMAAGELPYAYDFEQLVEMSPEAGGGAQALGGLAQFVGAYAGLGKLFTIGKGIIAQGASRGFAADFLGFQGDDGRITDLLLEMGVPDNMVTDFLRTDPNDPDYVGRFKNALEALPIGVLAESIGPMYRAVREGAPLETIQQRLTQLRSQAADAMANQIRGAEERIAREGSTLYSNPVGPVVDRALALAGRLLRETPEAVGNIRLGPPSATPKVSQLDPQYRVTVEGFQPEGTGKQSFIPKNMNPKNFGVSSGRLQEISDQFPDPLSSPQSYASMMAKVHNSAEVPAPPAWMIENANNMDEWSNWFSGLTDDQVRAANEGLSVQESFKSAYASGAGPELTGQLMLWSILSRRLSAFPHESGFLELANAAVPFIRKAAAGDWTDADTQAWLEMVPRTIVQDSPGRSATSNANDFGSVFLRKMAAKDAEGRSALQRLHEMIADPQMSGTAIRRAYYGLAEETGIANKILSFALLVSGRNDLVVLDRIQINRMWGGGEKIYDDVYTQFEGAQGLAQYEALERSLMPRVGELYKRVGRAEEGTVGRYHWESWVLSSGQVVSHPTLEAVVKAGKLEDAANVGTPVMEGRFHQKYYGVQYEKLAGGGNRYVYRTSDGEAFQFTKAQLDAMFEEAFKKGSGVLPRDFPGVSAFEGGDIPWHDYPGVDRGKLDEYIRAAGKPVSE